MTHATVNLGGTASGVVVGKVAHGLMAMTWSEIPVPDEQCFEAIKAGIEALPPNAKMFLNGGTFYGPGLSPANLELLARFFEKYPQYANRTFLSIKGGNKPGFLQSDCSPENLARSVDLVNEKLRGTKRLDLFQCGRIDPRVPVEVSIAALAKLKNEGKLDHIGMSACSAEALRRGHNVHPISVVEIQVSPISYGPETRKVIEVAKELGVSVAAYSPLAKGLFTRHVDLPAGYFCRRRDHNFAIASVMSEMAKRKAVTPAQICIAWVGSVGSHVIPMPGSSEAKRTLENCAGGDVVFTKPELEEINALIMKGAR